MQEALNFLQTTSPSYLLLASLDVMRRWMCARGARAVCGGGRRSTAIGRRDRRSAGAGGVSAGDDPRLGDHRRDPLRLVVNVSGTGWSGYEVERYLRTEFQVEDEMADWFNVVYVLSPRR